MLDRIGIALDRVAGLDPVLDAPQARADRGGERDVGIDVGRRDPVLDALRLLRARDDAQRRGAVLDAPGGVGRRPEAGDQARVGVHRAGHHREQLRHQRLLAADEPAHGRRTCCAAPSASWKAPLPVLMSRSEMWRWPDWPGQSRDHLAMKVAIQPRRLREDLGEGLEQGRLVGGLQRVVDADRGFEHAGAGLGVQALDLEIHRVREVEKVVVEIRVHRGAQHRIAEEARRDGLAGRDSSSRAPNAASRRRGRTRTRPRPRPRSPCPAAFFEDAAQHAARAGSFRIAGELAEEERQVVLERDQPHRLGQNAHGGVGIGGVPAGERRVVVELVVRIPAEHHVAEAEALLERRIRTCRGPCTCRA